MTAPIIPRKTCNKCGETYPRVPEYWHKDKKAPDGLSYQCKECARRKTRQWRDIPENAERDKQSSREWHRENAERVQAYQQENAEHIAEIKRQWRQANPDKVKEHKRKDAVRNKASYLRRSRKWQENNRESHNEKLRQQYADDPIPMLVRGANYRARKRSLPNTLTDNEWQRALDYFEHRCAVCNRPQGLWHKLAMDHWIPINDDDCPGTIATNVLPLCHGVGGCNNSKRDSNPLEWLIENFGERNALHIADRINSYFGSLQ